MSSAWSGDIPLGKQYGIPFGSSYGAGRCVGQQDLAMEMGYNSQSSFYRAFVKETGVPPSKYREESLRIKAAC